MPKEGNVPDTEAAGCDSVSDEHVAEYFLSQHLHLNQLIGMAVAIVASVAARNVGLTMRLLHPAAGCPCVPYSRVLTYYQLQLGK